MYGFSPYYIGSYNQSASQWGYFLFRLLLVFQQLLFIVHDNDIVILLALTSTSLNHRAFDHLF